MVNRKSAVNQTGCIELCLVFRIFFQILFLPVRLPLYFWRQFTGRRIARNKNLHFRIPDRFSSVIETGLIGRLISKEKSNYFEFLKFLELVRKDNRLKYVAVTIPDMEHIDLAKTQELQRALERIRESGKHLSAYLEGGSLKSLIIAGAAGIRASSAHVHYLTALPHSEIRFATGALKKLGIKVEVHSAGKYKSAGEIFSRTSSSPAARQNLKELLGNSREWIFREFERTVSLSESGLQELKSLLIRQSMSTARDLRNCGFLTHLLAATEFPQLAFPADKNSAGKPHDDSLRHPALHSFTGPGDRTLQEAASSASGPLQDFHGTKRASLDAHRFLKAKRKLNSRLIGKRKSMNIAIVSLEGIILSGRPDEDAKASMINAYGYANVLDALRESDEEAVFLYINSPGGSSDASEVLYQKIESLSRMKPVFAVLGGVAASGGYYIACAANRIYSSDACLTGSIGVIRMRPRLDGLYQKTGITTERMHFDSTTDILSESGPLSKASLTLLNENTEDAYRIFLERVARGRGLSVAEIRKQAEGRVYNAKSFAESGLIDACSTLYEAIHSYREEAGIPAKVDMDYIVYPQVRMDFRSMVKQELPVSPYGRLLYELKKNSIFYWNPELGQSIL